MAKDFLLEIGTEPMPARFIAPALEQLRGGIEALGLPCKSVRAVGTLRRLVVIAVGMSEKTEPKTVELKGPPAKLYKNADGTLTPAVEAFLRKNGLKASDLFIVDDAKGGTVMARSTTPAKSAGALLEESLPGLITGLQFPKTLTWEESGFRFGRPIRSLVAQLGNKVVPFSLAGVKSGKLSVEPAKYVSSLRNKLVLVDQDERRETLLKQLDRATSGVDKDPELLAETTWMTELPTAVLGRFEDRFLALPAPLLSLVLKKQLKFFPVLAARGLASAFVGVRDGKSESQAQVRYGYERVLTARLSDAAFFLERDRKTTLEAKLPQLERVTYQKALGSMSDKARRVAGLTRWLCAAVRQDSPVDEASAEAVAKLAYADLVTDVVREFPELQGAMGGFYARSEGQDERIALGLEQFYYPVASKTPLPATDEGALASLAGKLDSLAGTFSAGMIPTGSADPYALRRQAAGVVRILLEKQLPIDLDAALDQAFSLQPVKSTEAPAQLRDFIWGRAQSMFEELGYKTDEIRSVRVGSFQSLPRTVLRLSAIHKARVQPEFETIAAAFKRAANILRQAKWDDGRPVERAKLQAPVELALLDSLEEVEGRVHEKLLAGQFEESLRAMTALKARLDSFFEGVMVMVEDQELRRQRLALLGKLVRLFKNVADLSELQTPGAA
jgi:glycyl-tRNA synthetase beta chain